MKRLTRCSLRSSSLRRSSRWLALLGLCCACAEAVAPPQSPAPARQLVPVPICLAPLSPSAARKPLAPEEYWPLLWPAFEQRPEQLDARDRDCAGRQPLSPWAGLATPLRPLLEAASVSRSSDELEIIWLPAAAEAEQRPLGLLALGRRRERRLEIYALGVHSGDPRRTRFTWQRLGPRLVVSALEACEAEATDGCESSVSLYLARRGRLSPLGTLALARQLRAPAPSRGEPPPEYHFHATLKYRPDGIHLQEQLSVRDRARELRRSELERVLSLRGDRLVESEPSLWQQTLAELAAPR